MLCESLHYATALFLNNSSGASNLCINTWRKNTVPSRQNSIFWEEKCAIPHIHSPYYSRSSFLLAMPSHFIDRQWTSKWKMEANAYKQLWLSTAVSLSHQCITTDFEMKQSRVLVLLDDRDEVLAKHHFFIADERANPQPRQAKRKIQLLKYRPQAAFRLRMQKYISLEFGILRRYNTFNTNN